MPNTPPEAILSESLGSYKGFLAENFIAQELYSCLNSDLIAWSEGRSEIEFLINKNEDIIPLEVKSSSRSRKSKSLYVFVNKYKPKNAYKLRARILENRKKAALLPCLFILVVSWYKTRQGLRPVFGMVLQDTWLYNDTIMENIRYCRQDTAESFWLKKDFMQTFITASSRTINFLQQAKIFILKI